MLHRYLNIIQRWWWLLLIGTVVAGGAAYLSQRGAPTIHETNARLIVGPGLDSADPDLNALRAGARLMQTYAELPTTRPFQQEVIVNHGLNMTPEHLAELLEISTNEETQILTVRVHDRDAARAGVIANAVAETLVRKSPSNPNSLETKVTAQMAQQVSSLQEDIVRMETTISELSAQFQVRADIEVQQAILDMIAGERTRLGEANDTLATLLESLRQTTTNRVAVIEPASSAVVVPSQLGLTVAISALTGLILGLLMVLGFEFLQDLIRTKEELEEVTGVPVLGEIAKYQVVANKAHNRLVVHTQPNTAAAESYRTVATRFLLSPLTAQNGLLAGGVNQLPGARAAQPMTGPTSNTIAGYLNGPGVGRATQYTNGHENRAAKDTREIGTAEMDVVHAETVEMHTLRSRPTPQHVSANGNSADGASAAGSAITQHSPVENPIVEVDGVDPTRSYMITGMNRDQNTAEIAANLAIILAESGRRVVLIDANFGRPELDTLFGISPQPALVELLARKPGDVSLTSLDWCPGLFLIPSGYATQPSFTLLSSSHLEALMVELNQRVDVVMIIAPPIADSADCLLLASRVQNVILNLQHANLRRTQAREIVTDLRSVGANIFGTILSQGNGAYGPQLAHPKARPAQRQAQRPAPQPVPEPVPHAGADPMPEPVPPMPQTESPATRRRPHALRRIRVIKQPPTQRPNGNISGGSQQ